MARPIGKRDAQACLALVKEQFAEDITPSSEPLLYTPGIYGECWAITWEDGPQGWVAIALTGDYEPPLGVTAIETDSWVLELCRI